MEKVYYKAIEQVSRDKAETTLLNTSDVREIIDNVTDYKVVEYVKNAGVDKANAEIDELCWTLEKLGKAKQLIEQSNADTDEEYERLAEVLDIVDTVEQSTYDMLCESVLRLETSGLRPILEMAMDIHPNVFRLERLTRDEYNAELDKANEE